MDRKLLYLDIIFENCDVYRLSAEHITSCIINKINRGIGINCFQYEEGEVHDFYSCEEFILFINQKGLKTKGYLDDTKLEKRLSFKDITSVDLIYNDETIENILVPWDELDNQENSLQINIYNDKLYKEENLMVCIKRTPLTFKEAEENGWC